MDNFKYAKIAWKAYSDYVGGLNYLGNPLPSFEDIGEERQFAWKAAVDAVLKEAK